MKMLMPIKLLQVLMYYFSTATETTIFEENIIKDVQSIVMKVIPEVVLCEKDTSLLTQLHKRSSKLHKLFCALWYDMLQSIYGQRNLDLSEGSNGLICYYLSRLIIRHVICTLPNPTEVETQNDDFPTIGISSGATKLLETEIKKRLLELKPQVLKENYNLSKGPHFHLISVSRLRALSVCNTCLEQKQA